MPRQLAPTGHGVRLLGEDAEEDVLRGESPGEGDSHVPVVGKHPVLLPVEGEGGGDLDRLVAGRSHDERGPALPLESEHPVVDPAGEEHQAVHLHHLLVAQAELGVMEQLVEVHPQSAVSQFRSIPLRRKRRRSPMSLIRLSATFTAA